MLTFTSTACLPCFPVNTRQIEITSNNYIRDDRIISYEIPDLDTDCEIVWAGLHFSGSKPLYLASFYKPPNTTSQPLEALASSYNKLITLHPVAVMLY